VWVESAVCSGGQSDLGKTLASEGVFVGKWIPEKGGSCIRCQRRSGRPVG
jgi:hypothetical protein